MKRKIKQQQNQRRRQRRENWSMLQKQANAKHQVVLEQMSENYSRRMQAEQNEQTDVISDIRNHISPLTTVETK